MNLKKTSYGVFPKDVNQHGSSDFIPGARENAPALDYLFNRRRRYPLPCFLSAKVIIFVFMSSPFSNLLLLLYNNALSLSRGNCENTQISINFYEINIILWVCKPK